LHAIPKDASKSRVNAEFRQHISKTYGEYEKIYTDGSVMDNRTGFGIVLPNQTKRVRTSNQTSIFHAEIFAISLAIELTLGTKRVIITDSLSTLTALRTLYPTKNLAINKIRNKLFVDLVYPEMKQLTLQPRSRYQKKSTALSRPYHQTGEIGQKHNIINKDKRSGQQVTTP
jgi:RNase H